MLNKYVFLSHIIDELTPTYGSRHNFISEETSRIVNGDSSNGSKWIFSTNHLGTHIDVPKHFYEDGDDIIQYDAASWIFHNVKVLDVTCYESKIINHEVVSQQLPEDIELLLIRTGYEKYRGGDKYWNDNPGLSPDLAEHLRSNYKKLRAIGFDFISLTSWKNKEIGKIAHKQFLLNSNPIFVIEDMALSVLDRNVASVIVSPLRIRNANGSPVTVIAQLCNI
jgi:kynurenine formamidase